MPKTSKLMSLVYEAKTFEDKTLFKKLEQEGYNVEDILFEEPAFPFEDGGSSIPQSVLKAIKNNTNLCLFVNRGRGAGDGMLEDPSSGRVLLMYDRKELHPFIPEELKKYRKSLSETHAYYAKNPEELEEALIGVVRFV